MEVKHAAFLFGLMVIVPVGTMLASWSIRVRRLVFFLIVFGTSIVKVADINFISREWYRGSTVGVEIAALDLLCLILIGSSFFGFVKTRPRFYWPQSLGPMLLYFAWCLASVILADPKLFGFFELTKILRGVLLFFAVATFVREKRDLEILLAALAAAAMMEAGIALRDRYILGYHRIGATLGHPNSLSIYACMLAPALVSGALARISKFLLIACVVGAFSALLCVILSISRTGLVTVFVVTIGALIVNLGFKVTPRRVVVGVLVILVAIGLAYRAKDSLFNRFNARSLDMEYSGEGTEGRGVYFRLAGAIFEERPLLGVGLNNWSYWVSNTYGQREGFDYVAYEGTDSQPDTEVIRGSELDNAQAAPAHNLLALTLGELGAPGVVLFVFLWLSWFRMGASFVRRRSPMLVSRLGVGLLFSLVAVFLQSGTEWIFRQTNIFFLFHIMLGALAAMYRARTLHTSQSRISIKGKPA